MGRGAVETWYPWLKNMPRGLSELQNEVPQGKGAAFDRWLESAAKFLEEHPERYRENGGREPGDE